jgi:hypothetical protein
MVINFEPEDKVCLGEGEGVRGEEFSKIDALLREMLKESAAFRRNFARANADSLIEQ